MCHYLASHSFIHLKPWAVSYERMCGFPSPVCSDLSPNFTSQLSTGWGGKNVTYSLNQMLDGSGRHAFMPSQKCLASHHCCTSFSDIFSRRESPSCISQYLYKTLQLASFYSKHTVLV